jgi:hypothetical protein
MRKGIAISASPNPTADRVKVEKKRMPIIVKRGGTLAEMLSLH